MRAGRKELFAALEGLGIATTTVEHAALFSVEEARAGRGDLPGAHTKNLFLKSKKGSLWLVVALESTKVDLTALSKAKGCGRFSFAKPEQMRETLGVEPGSVTPFALINDRGSEVRLILDQAMMAHETLNFHPMENTATTAIGRDDLLTFLRAHDHEPEILSLDFGAPAA